MKNQHKVQARFNMSRLPLNKIVEEFELGNLSKREKSFLLYQFGKDKYIYLKDYGGLTFLGLDADEHNRVLTQLSNSFKLELSEYIDEIIVYEGSHNEEKYGEINIDKLTVEVAHIICLNLAQSAALFHYQSLSDNLLENTRQHTNELEHKGTVSLKRKKLMKYIGSTLNIKNKISENLYVFDTPMLAYENAEINKVDTHLNDELEIKYRYNAIKEQLNIIQENLDLFKDMNMHQHSSNLEWIIILLILFEVIHVVIDQIIK
ncbi:MAG: putative Rmd1/YagE family protein [Saprospiraceae bacterium]